MFLRKRRVPSEFGIRKCPQKKIALGQAVVSACRPRSFVPPVLLGVGVYIHRRYASKQLIQLLNSLGFCVNMAVVHRYEFSVLSSEKRPSPHARSFTQFCFDNADFNTRTLDGRNTFHCMGGINCTAPAVVHPEPSLPRLREVPNASVIAAMGKFNISWYRKPPYSGLKDIEIKELSITAPHTLSLASKIPIKKK